VLIPSSNAFVLDFVTHSTNLCRVTLTFLAIVGDELAALPHEDVAVAGLGSDHNLFIVFVGKTIGQNLTHDLLQVGHVVPVWKNIKICKTSS
jgi:hypothetical protein